MTPAWSSTQSRPPPAAAAVLDDEPRRAAAPPRRHPDLDEQRPRLRALHRLPRRQLSVPRHGRWRVSALRLHAAQHGERARRVRRRSVAPHLRPPRLPSSQQRLSHAVGGLSPAVHRAHPRGRRAPLPDGAPGREPCRRLTSAILGASPSARAAAPPHAGRVRGRGRGGAGRAAPGAPRPARQRRHPHRREALAGDWSPAASTPRVLGLYHGVPLNRALGQLRGAVRRHDPSLQRQPRARLPDARGAGRAHPHRRPARDGALLRLLRGAAPAHGPGLSDGPGEGRRAPASPRGPAP